jgi:hypothetical protein
MTDIPADYQVIDASASLIAKEKFKITRQKNKHFVTHPNGEVYMIGFGFGQKTVDNPKGFYSYWVWYQDKEPYGAMVNCELKDKYDSIDYFQTCKQNAEATISEVLKAKAEDTDGK